MRGKPGRPGRARSHGASCDLEEWPEFVPENREWLIEEFRDRLPRSEFGSIAAGLSPPFVQRPQRHGRIELNFQVVRSEPGKAGNVARSDNLEPAR